MAQPFHRPADIVLTHVFAGHFQAEKDIDAYLGLEYDVIGIEEATDQVP